MLSVLHTHLGNTARGDEADSTLAGSEAVAAFCASRDAAGGKDSMDRAIWERCRVEEPDRAAFAVELCKAPPESSGVTSPSKWLEAARGDTYCNLFRQP